MKYKPLDNGLKSIFKEYDMFVIDLWGVIHNGINLYQPAMEVLKNLKNNNKEFLLVSNAPRPGKSVANFLKTLKMNEEYFVKEIDIDSEIRLRINEKNGDKELQNIGNVKLNITRGENGALVGNIILDTEQFEMIEDEGKYTGGQAE